MPSSHLSAAVEHTASAAENAASAVEHTASAPAFASPPVESPTVVQVVQTLPDLEALIAGLTLKTTGAACVFAGLVRGETVRDDPHETTRLEYDAYVPMAEAKLAQVAAEMRERWPEIQGLAIVHRVGTMDVGLPIVYVACTSAHRDTGLFEATKYGIDRLKEIVPIWKKEIGTLGEVWVEGDYQPKAGE